METIKKWIESGFQARNAQVRKGKFVRNREREKKKNTRAEPRIHLSLDRLRSADRNQAGRTKGNRQMAGLLQSKFKIQGRLEIDWRILERDCPATQGTTQAQTDSTELNLEACSMFDHNEPEKTRKGERIAASLVSYRSRQSVARTSG
ncbi:hypothetical protein BP00DRAFT_73290 [Aspergillus indologenus CBS 114.80]|uniref:Uncharacterized protein n=1 Tax=Aspergillus indologenus CBS 114.80 TaxID=1450541 RepID=A0A2V5HTT5_9EURO|nr:hypothetical protein BP00DRAFT_73290 [Aspergillus indologenus CBS 114.80]